MLKRGCTDSSESTIEKNALLLEITCRDSFVFLNGALSE